MEEDTQPWPSAFTCMSTQFVYAQGPMTEHTIEEDTQPWPSASTCVPTQFEYTQGPMTELHDCGESERYRSESNHPGLC